MSACGGGPTLGARCIPSIADAAAAAAASSSKMDIGRGGGAWTLLPPGVEPPLASVLARGGVSNAATAGGSIGALSDGVTLAARPDAGPAGSGLAASLSTAGPAST